MSIAAVPEYLGQEFKDASPGLRFGLLLPIWTDRKDQEAEVRSRADKRSREADEVQDLLKQGMDNAIAELGRRERNRLPRLWEKSDFAAREAWKKVRKLTGADTGRMAALAERQQALSQRASGLYRIDAIAVAPFTPGLGNEHPLENGFAFLNPYGLPYLPGGGVKGVLRRAAQELASGEWGDSRGWSVDKSFTLQVDKKNLLSIIDVFFGLESGDGGDDHVRGVLSFWDVIPQIKSDFLMVEIMTPHQSHYYQKKSEKKSGDSVTPHDSGQTAPISFLTVPPGSGFTFHVVCDTRRLRRIAPDLTQAGDGDRPEWHSLLEAPFGSRIS